MPVVMSAALPVGSLCCGANDSAKCIIINRVVVDTFGCPFGQLFLCFGKSTEEQVERSGLDLNQTVLLI